MTQKNEQPMDEFLAECKAKCDEMSFYPVVFNLHARTAMPRLVREVERLQQENGNLQCEVDHYANCLLESEADDAE